MGWFDKIEKGLRKLDHYLDRAEEIVEKAIPAVVAINPVYAGYVSIALKVIQFVEDLTPELDEANEEGFSGEDKRDLAADFLTGASDQIPNGHVLDVGRAKVIVQSVLDTAKAVQGIR